MLVNALWLLVASVSIFLCSFRADSLAPGPCTQRLCGNHSQRSLLLFSPVIGKGLEPVLSCKLYLLWHNFTYNHWTNLILCYLRICFVVLSSWYTRGHVCLIHFQNLKLEGTEDLSDVLVKQGAWVPQKSAGWGSSLQWPGCCNSGCYNVGLMARL